LGYTTDFTGQFKFDAPLTAAQVAYLNKFSRTRRVKRDAEKADQQRDSVRYKVGLEVGPEGAYFVGAEGFAGQDQSDDILDYNHPPAGQPSLWCQWVPTEDGEAIEWDGNEKFYEYIAWIEYIIEHFLTPWGRTLSGEVSWQGESSDDRGVIFIKDNEVVSQEDTISNSLDSPSEDETVIFADGLKHSKCWEETGYRRGRMRPDECTGEAQEVTSLVCEECGFEVNIVPA